MSKEFNPVISFDVTSPESMIRTSVDPQQDKNAQDGSSSTINE